jgi:hypothetical protein
MLFADMKLQAHERGLANVRDLDSKNAMVGLIDPRLAITCINFTQVKGQVLTATGATKFPDIMTTKVGRYSQKQIFSVDDSAYLGSACNVFILLTYPMEHSPS